MPQKWAGIRMEPPMSVPRPRGAPHAAKMAPSPPLLPPGPLQAQTHSPHQHAQRVSFPHQVYTAPGKKAAPGGAEPVSAATTAYLSLFQGFRVVPNTVFMLSGSISSCMARTRQHPAKRKRR
jgi:hypothetical protein